MSRPRAWVWPAAIAVAAAATTAPLFRNASAIVHRDSYRASDWLEAAKHHWFARQRLLEDGVLPLWNPLLEGGLPSLAHPSDGTLSPFFLLPLALGEAVGMKANILLLTVLGALGVFALGRRWLRLSLGAAAVAGLSFAVAGWMPSRVAVGFYESAFLAPLPWVLVCVHEAAEAEDRRHGLRIAALGAFALCCLAAQLQLALAFAALQILLWAAVDSGHRRRRLQAAATILGATAALGAVKWLPMLEFVRARGGRAVGPEGPLAHPFEALEGILLGIFQIAEPVGRYTEDGLPLVPEYDAVGLPAVVVLLAAVAAFRWTRGRGLVALLTITLGLAWMPGDGTQASLFALLRPLPLFDSMRETARYVGYFVLLWTCLLGGLGAEELLNRWKLRDRLPDTALATLVLLTLLPSALRSGHLYGETFAADAPRSTAGPFHQIRLIGPPHPGADSFNVARYTSPIEGVGVIYDPEDLPPEGGMRAEGAFHVRANGSRTLNRSYRGEVWIVGGAGRVGPLEALPNRFRFPLEVGEAARVVVNQNYDPNWEVDLPLQFIEHQGLLAIETDGAWDTPVELRYRPQSLCWGSALSGLAALFALFLLWRPRRLAPPSAALALLLLLSSCADDLEPVPEVPVVTVPGTAANAGGRGSPATPTEASARAPGTVDRLGDTIQVCLLLPQTGEAASEGEAMRQGTTLAREQIDGETWRIRRLHWIEQDSASSEEGAVAGWHRCYDAGAGIVIGPTHPGAVSALIPVAAAHEAVHIVPDLGGAGTEGWGSLQFAVSPPATSMAEEAASQALSEGATRAAVLHIDGAFGLSLASAFEARFRAAEGAQVSLHTARPEALQSWTDAVAQIARSSPEHLFVVAPPDAARVSLDAVQASPALAKTQIWLSDWSMDRKQLEGREALAPRLQWLSRAPVAEAFATRFVERFGQPPTPAAAAAYDAVLLAASAAQGSPSPAPKDLAQALRSTRGMRSAFGTAALVSGFGVVYENVAGYRRVRVVSEGTGGLDFAGY